jgi:uncharacterized protein YrrD
MLYRISEIEGFHLRATDGTIGSVDDIYFDDATWLVRYIVADTGTWLSGRKVLLTPQSAGQPDVVNRLLPVQLTCAQVENSPDIDLARPVERAMEERLYRYYGWEPYWSDGVMPLNVPRRPGRAVGGGGSEAIEQQDTDEPSYQPHLRSADTVMHYYTHARDGDIGHVADFLLDPEAWMIRYMVIDTRNWIPGRKVLVSPQWIEDISWSENMVMLDLLKHQIRGAPEYRPGAPIERDYEAQLFEHYRRAPYW